MQGNYCHHRRSQQVDNHPQPHLEKIKSVIKRHYIACDEECHGEELNEYDTPGQAEDKCRRSSYWLIRKVQTYVVPEGICCSSGSCFNICVRVRICKAESIVGWVVALGIRARRSCRSGSIVAVVFSR